MTKISDELIERNKKNSEARREETQDSEQERAYKIKLQAQKEVEREDFEARVRLEKIKIRQRKSLWDRIFPWKIVRK